MADKPMSAAEDAYARYANDEAANRQEPFRHRRRANCDATGALRVDLYEQGLRDTRAMPVVGFLAELEE
jgi:hypothetical protein